MEQKRQGNDFQRMAVMFTGIIEEMGTIKKIEPTPSGKRFTITAEKVLSDLSIEDSISVSGVCLTVIECDAGSFQATVVQETLQTSILGEINTGFQVNLERAMKGNSRFGGHFVYGHVDGMGSIISIVDRGENRIIEIEVPSNLQKYMIKKGSVALDGISLTIADISHNRIVISIIPYTLQNTTIIHQKIGNKVNIEVDVVGKFIERFINSKNDNDRRNEKLLEFLQ